MRTHGELTGHKYSDRQMSKGGGRRGGGGGGTQTATNPNAAKMADLQKKIADAQEKLKTATGRQATSAKGLITRFTNQLKKLQG